MALNIDSPEIAEISWKWMHTRIDLTSMQKVLSVLNDSAEEEQRSAIQSENHIALFDSLAQNSKYRFVILKLSIVHAYSEIERCRGAIIQHIKTKEEFSDPSYIKNVSKYLESLNISLEEIPHWDKMEIAREINNGVKHQNKNNKLGYFCTAHKGCFSASQLHDFAVNDLPNAQAYIDGLYDALSAKKTQ
ncbi:MAG: hypothetical protein RJA98_3132 [Pseudomonadota bacterium]|jgi:hypothetical protein